MSSQISLRGRPMSEDDGGRDEMNELSSIEQQLEAAEQEEEGEEEDDQHTMESDTEASGTVSAETTTRTEDKAEGESSQSAPFTYEDTEMVGLYVREETDHAWTSAKNDAMAAVSKQVTTDEVPAREFQDAALRLVANHPAELAMLVLEERDVDVDDDHVREIVELLQG